MSSHHYVLVVTIIDTVISYSGSETQATNITMVPTRIILFITLDLGVGVGERVGGLKQPIGSFSHYDGNKTLSLPPPPPPPPPIWLCWRFSRYKCLNNQLLACFVFFFLHFDLKEMSLKKYLDTCRVLGLCIPWKKGRNKTHRPCPS